jgi:hypothetical protein
MSDWKKLSTANKAAAIWASLSAEEKAEMRAGKFPYPFPAFRAAENEGYNYQRLAYHLRRHARPEDYPPPSPVVWFVLGAMTVLLIMIILGYGGGVGYGE